MQDVIFLSKDLDKQNTLYHTQETKAIFSGIHCCLGFESITLPNVIYSLTKQANAGKIYHDHLF